ncbi:uncharacterized protein BYT42DRAFT_552098 [Radiomyces spectabilis]|uniref:uncharacterized protein n=1 Tax=Radiomyces spectabilis TaxID=64574 RepID=UPI0022203710|nr:uncharacterized protein BYT42DRAFT_552098 [Radiomyces spectabilis]KAI8393742.1 hypothetical protein BYT42DRAFT_552098 [Radiomyces spectabilis]
MHKLKNTFLRSHLSKEVEERRSHQFAKRLSANKHNLETNNPSPRGPPAISLDELSDVERPIYHSWWKDLDPFSLGTIDNEAAFKFLTGCGLPDHKMEQILAYFEGITDGLTELRFYAILRLIAHAQNGRSVNPDLVYLGAPIPRFQTKAIDALIKSDNQSKPSPASLQSNTMASNTWNKDTQNHAVSPQWWAEPSKTSDDPSSCFKQPQQQPSSQSIFLPSNQPMSPPMMSPPYSNPPMQQATLIPQPTPNLQYQASWLQDMPQIFNVPFNEPINIPTSNEPFQSAKNVQKQLYTHSRSRSVPFSISPAVNPSPSDDSPAPSIPVRPRRPTLISSRASMDADAIQRLTTAIDTSGIDTGQSLLLTQRFVPKPTNNPFENDASDTEDYTSPFEDHAACFPAKVEPNKRPNSMNMLPPPVPDKATKPAFPKYARNASPHHPFMLKRSQSHHCPQQSAEEDSYSHLTEGAKLFRNKSLGGNYYGLMNL